MAGRFNTDKLEQQLFANHSSERFNALTLEIFRFQAANNPIYGEFLEALKVQPELVQAVEDIPFLPVTLFKHHQVVSTTANAEQVFTSSGTTGSVTSSHHVASLEVYERSFMQGFERVYGPISEYCVLALLPAYLERSGSSLVYMANSLIERSMHPQSGFYLDDLDVLAAELRSLDAAGQKVLLLGVTFALLDLAEQHPMQLKHAIVMETGGMKGRRKELIRTDLHQQLIEAFGVNSIHSEYGMTELLSQAYSTGHGIYRCPPWMKVWVRDANDPMRLLEPGRTGGLNIIDLANLWSCSFLSTQDLGRHHADGSFEVLGRFDYSDLRGCSLLTA